MDEKLVITVTPDGNVSVDAQDFHGPMCKDTLEAMVTSMGESNVEFIEKPEFNEVVNCEKNYVTT